MKKVLAIMICGMLLVGSLSVFAAEAACPHTGDTYTEVVVVGRHGCTTDYVKYWYCSDCDALLNEQYYSRTSHNWSDEIIDGQLVTICLNCDMIK